MRSRVRETPTKGNYPTWRKEQGTGTEKGRKRKEQKAIQRQSKPERLITQKNKNKEAIPVRPDVQGLRIATPGLSSYLTYEVLRLLHTSLLACSNLSAYSTVSE